MAKHLIDLIPDCWARVLDFLSQDEDSTDGQSLARLLATSKTMQAIVAPRLYRNAFDYANDHIKLEFLLLTQAGWAGLEDPELVNCHGASPFRDPGVNISMDYFSLVKEWPSTCALTCLEPPGWNANRRLLWSYRCFVADKISELDVDVWDTELMQHILLFGHLWSLTLSEFRDASNEGYTQWMNSTQDTGNDAADVEAESRAQGLLRVHSRAWPGVLKHVDFKKGQAEHNHFGRMLKVQEAMDGKWCRQDMLLNLSNPSEPNLFKVLQAKDLPRQLRTLAVEATNPEFHASGWSDTFADFVSCCQKMDRVSMSGMKTEILLKVFDRLKQIATSNDSDLRKHFQWRLFDLWDVSASGDVTVPEIISNAVAVLGADLEELAVSVIGATLQIPTTPGKSVELNIQNTWSLPQLDRLDIDYPWIGSISVSGFSNLRCLEIYERVSTSTLVVPTGVVNKSKWTAPRQLEELDISGSVAARFDFECLQYLKQLRRLAVKFLPSDLLACENIPLINFDPQFSGATRLGDDAQPFGRWILPKLVDVCVVNEPARVLQLQFLKICPRLETLALCWDYAGEFELDMIDLENFKQHHRQHSALQSLQFKGMIHITADTLACLLSVPGPLVSLQSQHFNWLAYKLKSDRETASLFPKLRWLSIPELLRMASRDRKEEEKVAAVVGHALNLDQKVRLFSQLRNRPQESVRWWQEWLASDPNVLRTSGHWWAKDSRDFKDKGFEFCLGDDMYYRVAV